MVAFVASSLRTQTFLEFWLTLSRTITSVADCFPNSLVAKPWATCTVTVTLTLRVTTDKPSSILIYLNKSMVIYTERNGIDYKSSKHFVKWKVLIKMGK